MTRITIETNIPGSDQTNKATVEDSKDAVTIDDMFQLFKQALAGLGFSVEGLQIDDTGAA